MPVLCFHAGKVMNEWLCPGESWDDLVRDGLGVIQPISGYRFAMDAVLLAYFAAGHPATHILDLGTGCGVIPLLLASRMPMAHVTGVEIQLEQADRARRSVVANGKQEQINIISGDLKSSELLAGHRYDLITINPPFYPQGRGKLPAKDSVAVSRHEVLCTLSDIFIAVTRWLAPGGRFCLILPPARQQEALALAASVKLGLARFRAIHPREHRDPNLLLMEFMGEDNIKVLDREPPLYVYQADGNYTPELMAIYFTP